MTPDPDIAAIKTALKFLVKREMEKAVEEVPNPSKMGRWRTPQDATNWKKREIEKTKAPFLDVLKGLE